MLKVDSITFNKIVQANKLFVSKKLSVSDGNPFIYTFVNHNDEVCAKIVIKNDNEPFKIKEIIHLVSKKL